MLARFSPAKRCPGDHLKYHPSHPAVLRRTAGATLLREHREFDKCVGGSCHNPSSVSCFTQQRGGRRQEQVGIGNQKCFSSKEKQRRPLRNDQRSESILQDCLWEMEDYSCSLPVADRAAATALSAAVECHNLDCWLRVVLRLPGQPHLQFVDVG